MTARKRKPTNPVAVISDSMIQYNSHGCQVKVNASSTLVNELRQVSLIKSQNYVLLALPESKNLKV